MKTVLEFLTQLLFSRFITNCTRCSRNVDIRNKTNTMLRTYT